MDIPGLTTAMVLGNFVFTQYLVLFHQVFESFIGGTLLPSLLST